jgi:hypothetical protein
MDLEILRKLGELGAAEFQHLNGPLISHLVGTYQNLKAWGSREELCLAGLYHAVYGTAAFNKSLISVSRRHQIAEIIGKEAENIVYYYGACDRDVLYSQIGQSAEITYTNRFTGNTETLTQRMLSDLLELTLANELEIVTNDRAFLEKQRSQYESLFGRFEKYVSQSAYQAYLSVFSQDRSRSKAGT